jgi:hypothetical protein
MVRIAQRYFPATAGDALRTCKNHDVGTKIARKKYKAKKRRGIDKSLSWREPGSGGCFNPVGRSPPATVHSVHRPLWLAA